VLASPVSYEWSSPVLCCSRTDMPSTVDVCVWGGEELCGHCIPWLSQHLQRPLGTAGRAWVKFHCQQGGGLRRNPKGAVNASLPAGCAITEARTAYA
jgi:hypothetical protein